MSMHPQLSHWLAAVSSAFNADELIKITVTKPGSGAGDLKSIDIRPIVIKRETKLSFTHHHKTRDIVKNYGLAAACELIAELLAMTFSSARLHTVTADLGLARQGDHFILVTAKPTMQQGELAHNRAKNHLIASAGKSYLQGLGLADAQGQILKTAGDKFRQINKYIEIVDGLIKDLPQRKLRIVDMGAGKGYLTFALYDHVVNTLKRDCDVVGVEYRSDLVKLCNEIAVTAEFTGLKFVEGTIAGFDCKGADMVIALHACDTATDDAIAKAIKAEAQIIVVAPCCHKQIRREMREADGPNDLAFLLKFGTYQERLAEMITDGLRAKLMERSGYESNLFEFISDAHTPKNVMIVGKRLSAARSDVAVARIAAEIAEVKTKFGIGVVWLERLLGF